MIGEKTTASDPESEPGFQQKLALPSVFDGGDLGGLQAHGAQQEGGNVIAQANHGRVIVILTATVGAAAVPGRLSRAGLIVARGLLTGLLEAGLFLLRPGLLGAGLAHGARGAGGAILTGGAGLARLADLTGLLVCERLGRRFGAGEAFGPCG